MDIGGWLRSLGLEQYEAAFHENAIDFSVLPDLTERILRISASCLAIAANCCERSQTSKLRQECFRSGRCGTSYGRIARPPRTARYAADIEVLPSVYYEP
jgi:hypothetical protein